VGQLYQNIYDNPSRVVTGVVTIYPDDVQILCDSSAAAITINLLEIPAFKWNVNYKLYIADYTNTASTNNITINAGAGQTINGGSSIVIDSNGGACVIQVGSNTTYIATFYPLPVASPLGISDSLGPVTTSTTKITFTNALVTQTSATEVNVTTTGGVSAITALSPLTGGTITTSGNIGITQASGSANGYLSSSDFTAFNNKVDSVGVTAPITDSGTSTAPIIGIPAASGSVNGYLSSSDFTAFSNKVDSVGGTYPLSSSGGTTPSISIDDTGWVDCDGFAHQALDFYKPQYRIYGKQIFFRGIAIVPLASNLAGTTFVPMTWGSVVTKYYNSDPYPHTFVGTSGAVNGMSIIGQEAKFNLGGNIIPSGVIASRTITPLFTPIIIGKRPVAPSTGSTNTVMVMTAPFQMLFGKGSLSELSLYPLRSIENNGFQTNGGNLLTNSFGTSNIRQIAAVVKNGQFMANYTSMNGGAATSSAVTAVSFPQDYDIYLDPTTSTNPTFLFDLDSSKVNEIGGWQIPLDGLSTFID